MLDQDTGKTLAELAAEDVQERRQKAQARGTNLVTLADLDGDGDGDHGDTDAGRARYPLGAQ